MLDHDHSVADITETSQNTYKPVCITRMQSDARLIQNIHRTYKGTAKGSDKIDPLALTAGQCVACPVQCQISKSDIGNILQAGHNLGNSLIRDGMLIFSKSDITEERQEFTRIHAQELINILSS